MSLEVEELKNKVSVWRLRYGMMAIINHLHSAIGDHHGAFGVCQDRLCLEAKRFLEEDKEITGHGFYGEQTR